MSLANLAKKLLPDLGMPVRNKIFSLDFGAKSIRTTPVEPGLGELSDGELF